MRTQGGQEFIFETPVTVAAGSTLLIDIQPMTPEQILSQYRPELGSWTAVPAMRGFEPLVSKNWPALQDALQALQHATADVATTLRNTLPTASPRLVPTALFFLAALRMGGIENWLGPNTLQSLRDMGKRDIADRLAGDFSRLSAQSKEPLTNEWRAISIPLQHDEQISQMQFFIRRQRVKGAKLARMTKRRSHDLS
jgi:hypothetical protein